MEDEERGGEKERTKRNVSQDIGAKRGVCSIVRMEMQEHGSTRGVLDGWRND